MKTFRLVLIPALVVTWLVSSPGNAKEQDPTVESILAQWEGASQTCRTLDAKMVYVSGDKIVRVFDDVKINNRPADRDILVKPVPPGYRVLQAEDVLLGKNYGQREQTR